MSRRRAAAGLAAAALALGAGAQAGVLRHCEPPPPASAVQQDRQLRFAELIRAELERSGQPLAIVARSGMDLARIGQRYSHAGFALRASTQSPWSVRQLYYDCEERRPRIFDQGLPGFVLGMDDADRSQVSALLLPAEAAAALERAALDDRRALQLLSPVYSANAYAYGLRYQNCNQWVVEMLAAAWSGERDAGRSRADAQAWLREQGYRPTRIDIATQPWLWFALALPWLHADDHPQADVEQGVLEVSMPASIEGFVMAALPGVRRVEFCRVGTRVVVRRDGVPLDAGCSNISGDDVIAID
jgi:hypothetical protein